MKSKLPEGWKETRLGDVVNFNPRETIRKGVIAKKISMDKVNPFERKIDGFEVSEYKGGTKFKNGDTLFSRITPCLENGKIAQVDILNNEEIGFGSTEFIILREVKDVTVNDYIYYLAKSNIVRDIAIKSMTGTSGRQRAQKDVIEDISFGLPPIEEQKAIADTLSILDDKIESNNKINENLEKQAQALFKHWFVDFEFPDKNGNPYKSSGGEIIESELGLIPKGWKVDSLGKSKLGKLVSSGVSSFEGKKIYLATADVDNTNIINNDTYVSLDDKPSRANMQPKPNTVWFAKMKDSRKLIFVDKKDLTLQNDYIFSTGFAGIEGNEQSIYYLWTYIQSKLFDKKKNLLCTGTTMQAINNKNIKRIKIILPKTEELNKFNDIVRPMFKKIICNRNQSIYLSKLRDILLPKLMNGEIRIPLD